MPEKISSWLICAVMQIFLPKIVFFQPVANAFLLSNTVKIFGKGLRMFLNAYLTIIGPFNFEA